MKPNWQIDEHSTVDKSFGMGNDKIWVQVEFDDVNHAEVEAATNYLNDLIQLRWNENDFKTYYRKELEKKWEDDKDLREEHPVMEDFVNLMLE